MPLRSDRRLLCRREGQREVHPKGGSAAWCGFKRQSTARLFGKTHDHAEPEAATATGCLGGEKRFEDPGLDVLGHARPRIGDTDASVRTRGHILQARRRQWIAGQYLVGIAPTARRLSVQFDRPVRNVDGSALRHGVARIEAKVDQRSLQMRGIGAYMDGRCWLLEHDGAAGPQRMLSQFRQTCEERLYCHRGCT